MFSRKAGVEFARSPFIVCGLLLLAFVLSLSGAAIAQDADELAKTADKALRDAQRNLFSRKFDQSVAQLKEARALLDKLKAADPDHGRLKSLESKYARQKRDLDRRMGKSSPSTTGGTAPVPKTGAKEDKLPGGVTSRLRIIDGTLKRVEAVLAKEASPDWKAKEAERRLQSARDAMAQIQKSYGAKIPAGHPEVKAREDRIAALEKAVAQFKKGAAASAKQAAGEQAAREALSNEWLARINPFILSPSRPGHDKTKYLIPAGTADLKELEKRKKIFDQASAVFTQYQKTAFPAGKTDALERAEKELAYALKSFSEGYKESLGRFLQEAETRINQASVWLTNQEKKDDGKQKPLTLQKDILPNIKKMIAAGASTVAKDDAKLAALERKLADLEKRNAKLHQLRKERTYLTPDRYEGGDLATLKAKAAEFLKKKHADAKVLRTTVISPDWKEERVIEHTDTTKTAIRYRVTRSVTAQIAGKRGAEVFLFTIHVAKDKQSDGTFGPLHGHVMFTDPMLEKNVNKPTP